MQFSTDTAASQTNTSRSKVIRRDLSKFLRELRNEGKSLDIITEAQILGYFEQLLFELEKYESHDIRDFQSNAG